MKSECLLVDGYNLIRATALFQRELGISLEAARRALQDALRAYGRRTGARIELYYDGDGDLDFEAAQREGDLQIFFSRAPEKADDLIKRAAQARHGARWLRVVTSDGEIRRFARRHKIRTTPADAFVDELLAPGQGPARAAPAPLPAEFDPDLQPEAEEVDEWEARFAQQGSEKPKKKKRPRTGAESDPALAKEEVDEWEALFKKRPAE